MVVCTALSVCKFALHRVLARVRVNGNVCRALLGLCLRQIACVISWCVCVCVCWCVRLRLARSTQSSRGSHKGAAFILTTSGHRSTHRHTHNTHTQTRTTTDMLAKSRCMAINTTPMSVYLKGGKHGRFTWKTLRPSLKCSNTKTLDHILKYPHTNTHTHLHTHAHNQFGRTN